MKRNIIRTCVLGLGLMALASCDDPMDELTSIIYDRVFSPVDLESRSVGETSATLQWVASKGAINYTVEVFADDSLTFEGTPVQTLTVDENSVNLTGLVYDTQYSARVMANDSTDAERNSTWSEIYFRTSAQNIFDDIVPTNVSDKAITVTWPAGETVTRVTVTNTVTGEVVVTRDFTADEIAAGCATVEGLSAETSYEIRMYNGEKRRGTKTFTTIASLDGTTQVHEGDNLLSLLENASDGEIFTLHPGTFVLADDETKEGEAACVTITKSITIKGIYPTALPTIKGRFQLDDGASLSISQAVLDGADNATTDQAFNYKTDDVTYDSLIVQNCEIKNFAKGIIYLNVASTINTVTFNNCLIHDNECDGGDLFDSRKGRINEFNLTNSTVYASATERDFIRMDDASSSMGGGTPVINVKNCTIDGVSNSSSKRLLYVRYVGNVINWENNLVTNTKGIFSNQSKTGTPSFKNNSYYNTPNLKVVTEGGNLFTDESGEFDDDPKYKDAEGGDFTIQNEDVSSRQVGDPRWYTAQ